MFFIATRVKSSFKMLITQPSSICLSYQQIWAVLSQVPVYSNSLEMRPIRNASMSRLISTFTPLRKIMGKSRCWSLLHLTKSSGLTCLRLPPTHLQMPRALRTSNSSILIKNMGWFPILRRQAVVLKFLPFSTINTTNWPPNPVSFLLLTGPSKREVIRTSQFSTTTKSFHIRLVLRKQCLCISAILVFWPSTNSKEPLNCLPSQRSSSS